MQFERGQLSALIDAVRAEGKDISFDELAMMLAQVCPSGLLHDVILVYRRAQKLQQEKEVKPEH